MSMVCGLDLHRQQITFDALETVSGEVWKGRVWQPDRERFRRWLRHDVAGRADGEPVAMAVEGCTGWRYVAEEIVAAGFEVHVAEPADTQAARGNKHRAKTDRSDARLLGELLRRGELPESWVPPMVVLEWRERVRLYKSLLDQRRVWIQRIHAELFQHGVAVPQAEIGTPAIRTRLASDEVMLTVAARQRIAVELRDDRRHRRPPGPVAGAAATLRQATAGVSSPDRSSLRDRSADRRGGVVRARRLSPLHPFAAGGAPQRVGRRRRRLRSAPRRWLLVPAGPGHAALGAVRSRHVRLPARAAPTTPTTRRSSSVTTASWQRSPSPASWPAAATTRCAASTPTWCTPSRPEPCRRRRPPGSLTPTSRVLHRGQLPPRACPPTFGLDGLITLMRPRSPRGTSKSRLLSPTTSRSSSTQETQSAPRRRQTAHRQRAPALGLVKVISFVLASGDPSLVQTVPPTGVRAVVGPAGWHR